MSWTLSLFRKFSGCVELPSIFTLRQAAILERRGGLSFTDTRSIGLKAPYRQRIKLRPASNDVCSMEEVLLKQVYAPAVQACAGARRILDLGANIGLSSVFFAAHCPEAQVLAVEPDFANFQLLAANATSDRIRVLHAAAAARQGVLFVPPVTNGEFDRQHAEETGPGTPVLGLPVEGILRYVGWSQADIVKIDIEGAELQVFLNPGWLDSFQVVAIEFHGTTREDSQFDSLVTARGFVVEDHGHTVIARRPKP